MEPEATAWFDQRTFAPPWPSIATLVGHKFGAHITVILPALNEQATVGAIVTAIREHLMSPAAPLVDHLVVLDSGSSDRTAAVATAAGASVLDRSSAYPDVPVLPGKGEAMWRALAATTGDLVVFIDADLHSFTPDYVVGLLTPLLADPEIALVKAVYERPLMTETGAIPAGGGRVTELVARPLLNAHWPMLAGVAQPLAGEYAARRTLLESLPFPVGYGVEFALLVDTAESLGISAIAQVDLGVRVHRHHDEQRLGRMAAEIWQTALRRLDPDARIRRGQHTDPAKSPSLVQFYSDEHGLHTTTHEVMVWERPPLASMPDRAPAANAPTCENTQG